MSAWKIIGGLVAAAAVTTVVVIVATSGKDEPRPSPTVAPGAPPAPGAIPDAAEPVTYAGHTIYIWEELDDGLAFEAWRWVTVDPSGLVFETGNTTTPDLTGAAEARKTAQDNIDRKFQP